ncbi:MAG: LamG-like jellyroll fold domain-containing protein [Candidatus Hermodarchaeota archaeon]
MGIIELSLNLSHSNDCRFDSKNKDTIKMIPSNLDGMVAWYKFDGNVNDSSGNERNLTNLGATLAKDRYGNPKSAYYFDGSNCLLMYNFPVLNANFTVSFWAKIVANPDDSAPYIFLGDKLEYYFQWVIKNGPDYTWFGTRYETAGSSGGGIGYEWVQVTWVIESRKLCFKNGILFRNMYRTDNPFTGGIGDTFMIGGYDNAYRRVYFTGYMDDVRIWDRALNNTEVMQLYLDTDNDWISDWDELNYYFTDYLNNDTDNDNINDGWEIHNGFNPFDSADNESDGDLDGLINVLEFNYKTNPHNNDTDNDRLIDGDEIHAYSSDPLDSDTDEDGILDGEEVWDYFTLPTNNDTDSDLMPDGWEIINSLNPIVVDNETDSDSDGLINILEYQENTHPMKNDTDSDDLLDGLEVNSVFTNPLLPDTDMDIMTDGWEYYNGLNPLSSGESYLDYDNDGLMNLIEFKVNSDPNEVDTDGDGFSDEDEVADFSDPSDPLDIPFGLGETTANIAFYLNEMYTDPYMHTRPSTINYDFTTAFYKYDDNVDAFVTKRWAPYTGSAVFISTELLFPNYFITSARVIIHALTPLGTSIDIYITNNYFKTEYQAYNNTKINFQEYGRQLALKLVLSSTDPSVTPLFYGFTITSVGIKYNESKFSYPKTYHLQPSSKNEYKTSLKTMTFKYSGHTIRYAFEWRFERLEINKTHDSIRCYIYVHCISNYLVAYQNNYFRFDLNTTINGVDFRFLKVKGFQTPYITSGKLAERTLFNIVTEHEVCEKIILNASISYRAWNNQGGDVTGSMSISTEFYQYGPEPEPIDDEMELIIPGYNPIFVLGILTIFLFCLIVRNKFKPRPSLE